MGLNSHGSATFSAAAMGKQFFFEKNPERTLSITLIDSLSYSYGYGYPLVLAAGLRDAGKSAAEITDFLCDFMRHRELYFAMYTLQFAQAQRAHRRRGGLCRGGARPQAGDGL